MQITAFGNERTMAVAKNLDTTTNREGMSVDSLCADDSESDSARAGTAPDELSTSRGRKVVVLLAEDNRTDVLMVEEAIEEQGLPIELHVVDDGEKACEFLEQTDRNPAAVKPDVLLLDLNLPKRTGKDVLACLRRSKVCHDIPVLIITSSDASKERDELARLGVARYFRKPASYDEFMKLGSVLQGVLDEYKLQ
jgi:chemotaxis family two-component system response regulator Rcp1